MPHHVLLFVSTDKLEVGILPQNYIPTQHWSKAQGRICVANHNFLGKISAKEKCQLYSSLQQKTAEALDSEMYTINTGGGG
jgi:hypothetical protein